MQNLFHRALTLAGCGLKCRSSVSSCFVRRRFASYLKRNSLEVFFLQISLICWALISYCVLITRSCQDVRDLVELTVAKMEMCPISIWSHAHLKNCWHISSWKHKFVEGTTWLGLWCWNALWSTTPKEEYVPAPRKPGIDFGKTLFADKYKTKAAHQPQLCLDLCAALSTGLVLAFCPIPSWTFKQQSKCDHRFHNVRSRDCCVF